MRISDWSSDVCSSDLSGPCGPRPSAFTGREARGAMTWAPGGNALGGECPPAPAFGRRLLLYFAPKDIPTRVRLSRCFKGTKLEASLFRQPAIRRPGLRSRRTARDWKSVVEGKGCEVRVDSGGR